MHSATGKRFEACFCVVSSSTDGVSVVVSVVVASVVCDSVVCASVFCDSVFCEFESVFSTVSVASDGSVSVAPLCVIEAVSPVVDLGDTVELEELPPHRKISESKITPAMVIRIRFFDEEGFLRYLEGYFWIIRGM